MEKWVILFKNWKNGMIIETKKKPLSQPGNMDVKNDQ